MWDVPTKNNEPGGSSKKKRNELKSFLSTDVWGANSRVEYSAAPLSDPASADAGARKTSLYFGGTQ